MVQGARFAAALEVSGQFRGLRFYHRAPPFQDGFYSLEAETPLVGARTLKVFLRDCGLVTRKRPRSAASEQFFQTVFYTVIQFLKLFSLFTFFSVRPRKGGPSTLKPVW
jgi:hypothetical protein